MVQTGGRSGSGRTTGGTKLTRAAFRILAIDLCSSSQIVRLTEEGATVRATNVMLNETIKSLRDEINHNAELHTTRLNNNAKTIASLKAEIAKLEKALRSKEDQVSQESMATLLRAVARNERAADDGLVWL